MHSPLCLHWGRGYCEDICVMCPSFLQMAKRSEAADWPPAIWINRPLHAFLSRLSFLAAWPWSFQDAFCFLVWVVWSSIDTGSFHQPRQIAQKASYVNMLHQVVLLLNSLSTYLYTHPLMCYVHNLYVTCSPISTLSNSLILSIRCLLTLSARALFMISQHLPLYIVLDMTSI